MSLENAKLLELPFPMKGVHESSGVAAQPEGTSPLAQNVRGYDLVARRDRGCQRSGMAKFWATRSGDTHIEVIAVANLGVAASDITAIADIGGGAGDGSPWQVAGPSGFNAVGTGPDYTVNSLFKLARIGASATLTIRASSIPASAPAALDDSNTTDDSFVHLTLASPNPQQNDSVTWEYDLGTSVLDDNGALGDGTAARELTVTGLPAGTITMKQAGEQTWADNFTQDSDGYLPTVSTSRWVSQTPITVSPTPTQSMMIATHVLTFPNTGNFNVSSSDSSVHPAISYSDTGAAIPTPNAGSGCVYVGTSGYDTTFSSVFAFGQYQLPQNQMGAGPSAQWTISTPQFLSSGRGWGMKFIFQLDATKVSYMTGTLKAGMDSVPRGFVYVASLACSSSPLWEVDFIYDSIIGGWIFVVLGNGGSGVARYMSEMPAGLLKVDGTNNTLVMTQLAGGTATVKLNGTTISTVTANPTSVPTALHLAIGSRNDLRFNTFNQLPGLLHFVHPLSVTYAGAFGDQDPTNL